MTPAQRLVNRIREFVNGFEQDPNPMVQDLAIQFSTLCRDLNERLLRCDDFLDKGRRSEAIQEALSNPPIFDLVQTLDFDELKNWRNLCIDLNMPPPPEIAHDTVERLRDECTTEQLLEPLLREFRRLVHTGTRDERANVLRRIRQHDPANPVWQQNLEPLEREQLDEEVAAAEDAMAASDYTRIQELHADMTHPGRVVSPPPDILRKMGDMMRHKREQDASEEGEKALEQLREQLEKKDYQLLQPALQKWQRLVKYDDFHPTDTMLATANQAQQWYQQETRRHELARQFESALAALRLTLDRPPVDVDELERCWAHLLSCNQPIAPAIDEEVTRVLDELRDTRARKRRHRATALTTVLLVVIVGLAVAGITGYRTYNLRKTRSQLATLWEYERYAELETFLERLHTVDPDRYEDADVQHYVAQLNRLQENDAQRLAEYQRAMDLLQAASTAGYALGESQIANLLAKARNLSENDAEIAQIDSWEQTWQTWRTTQQTQRDDVASKLARRLRTMVDQGKAAAPSTSPAEELRSIEAAKALLPKGRDAVAEASPDVRKEWDEAVKALNAWTDAAAKRIEDMQQKEARRQQELAAIEESLIDIPSYKTKLEAFTAAYPGSPATLPLKKALAEIPMYADAVALERFQLTQIPRTANAVTRLETLLSDLPGKTQSVWHDDLSKCLTLAKGSRNLPDQLARLRQLPFYDIKQVRVRKKGDQQWQVFYYPEAFHQRDYQTPEGANATEYWGRILTAEAGAATQLQHINFKSPEYDVVLDPVPANNLIPAASFINELLLALPEDDLLYTYLLNVVAELAERTDIPPVPKAELMTRIATAVHDNCPFAKTATRPLADLFQGIALNVPWISPQHPQVVEAETAINERLNDVPPVAPIIAEIDLNAWLCLASVSRKVGYVGLVQPNETGTAPTPKITRGNPASVWAVLPARPGSPSRFAEVLHRTEDGTYAPTPGTGIELFMGQLLFAPAGGVPVDAVFSMTDAPQVPGTKALEWPESWPVNTRNVPVTPANPDGK